jgi:LysW-gamma-L-alpha-aminoadipyl-6-phosphate/LysW-L-glutamyl-5-phosphate reductase
VNRVRVAIVGGTGYGGMELLRYLLGHEGVEITAITSRTESGTVGDVHPHLRGLTDLKFTSAKAVDLAKSNDCLFFATPHGVAKKEVPDVLAASATVKVIDLSQDWRHDVFAIDGAGARPQWLRDAAYGLPECGGRAKVAAAGCRLVANPGCHASAAILALHPLASSLWGGQSALASIVSITGSSGSGATPSQGTHHPERFSNFRSYRPLAHQHEPEIVACLAVFGGAQDPRVAFVPCSGPFSRGIANVVTLDLSEGLADRGVDVTDDGASLGALRAHFDAVYAREPFIRFVPDTPEVRAVAGTNFADIGLTVRRGVACITVAICNLGKGMAGTAVQNLNLLFKFPETTGLLRPGAGL